MPCSQPSYGNCDAQDPAAWVEGLLPSNSDVYGMGVLIFTLFISHEMVFYCELGVVFGNGRCCHTSEVL